MEPGSAGATPISKEKRKFLKTIYAIQESFGVGFAGVSRTFSFGIQPTEEERKRLEIWFKQVGAAKGALYEEIFEDFKKNPAKYLGGKFDYGTFFRGKQILADLKKKYDLITSEPIGEGLRMEVSINSFIKNHKRLFNEAKDDGGRILEMIGRNKVKLDEHEISMEFPTEGLTLSIKKICEIPYVDIIGSYADLKGFENMVLGVNGSIAEYNYELNQIIQANHLRDLYPPDRLGRMASFPGTVEGETCDGEKVLKELRRLAAAKPSDAFISDYIEKTGKKATRRFINQKLSFERRLAFWLVNEEKDIKRRTEIFMKLLEDKIKFLEAHYRRKEYDSANKNLYFGLLALKARLANPDKIQEINMLKSQLSGLALRVRGEREIITVPGFSWGHKPLKNVALAFRDGRLYACIAASTAPFKILKEHGKSAGTLRFVKTTGGSRKRTARKPKKIEYVFGEFDVNAAGTPLFLPLHFGKSHSRRYLFNKNWGLFSDTPKVFLNNGRLKRTKRNPGDKWTYFFDITLSADEKVFGLSEFRKGIFRKAKAVIGIDRGEVNPIAYAVVKLKDGTVIGDGGTLGRKEYIDKLKEYDAKRRKQQAAGRIVSKNLRAKISRLQKTTLETAVSEIISLAAKHRAAIVIENLGGRFAGQERSLIPKKTYKRVEELLSAGLNFGGLLRIDNRPGSTFKYYGALVLVSPGGTSQTCPDCGVRWASQPPRDPKGPYVALSDVLKYSLAAKYKNIEVARGKMGFQGKSFSLNPEWMTYSRTSPAGEKITLNDLGKALIGKNKEVVERLLVGALRHRPDRDTFVCHACGFKGDADKAAAVNIARRGAERMRFFLLYRKPSKK